MARKKSAPETGQEKGAEKQKSTLSCDFCGKYAHEVEMLVAGPGTFICSECVHLCLILMLENDALALRKLAVDYAWDKQQVELIEFIRGLPHAHNNNALSQPRSVTEDRLADYVDRIGWLLDLSDYLKGYLKNLKARIKAEGFNVKAVDRLVAIRRGEGAVDRNAKFIDDLLLYARATGTPLDMDLGGDEDNRQTDG